MLTVWLSPNGFQKHALQLYTCYQKRVFHSWSCQSSATSLLWCNAPDDNTGQLFGEIMMYWFQLWNSQCADGLPTGVRKGSRYGRMRGKNYAERGLRFCRLLRRRIGEGDGVVIAEERRILIEKGSFFCRVRWGVMGVDVAVAEFKLVWRAS